MRYAIVSDLHAWLPAWQSVLADMAANQVDRIICLGDVTGYGPDPAGVLDLVYRKVHATLMGNHDAAVCGIIDPELFTDRARKAVLLHRTMLSKEGIEWLKKRPLVLTGPGFRCAHGDFSTPSAFRYILEPEEAMPSWEKTTEQLLFVGHTHMPSIHVIGASGQPHLLGPGDFCLEEGKRYIINPGSVGYPRVGECRSSYCIYDDAEQSIHFRSLPFDSESYRVALEQAGMDADPWLNTSLAPRHLPTLRERLSFEAPLTREQEARGVAYEAQIHPRARIWRATALISAVALIAVAIAATLVFSSLKKERRTKPLFFPAAELPTLMAPGLHNTSNLLPQFPTRITADGELSGWRYGCFSPAGQQVYLRARSGSQRLSITNATKARFRLESPMISLGAASGKRRMRLSCLADLEPETVAHDLRCHLICHTIGADGTPEVKRNLTYQLGVRPGTSELLRSFNRKIELPNYATHIMLCFEAEFNGTLTLQQPTLTWEQH